VRQRIARRPAGTLGADADSVGGRTATPSEPWGRARSQKRLPVEVRQRLLDAINAGQPFRAALRDLGLTSNRVFGLTRTD
jgi:hypothetical protein